jgi:hypothetical protein
LFVTYILTEDMSLWLIFFLHNYKGLIVSFKRRYLFQTEIGTPVKSTKVC